MRFAVGVSAAFGAGTLIGILVGRYMVEEELKQKYKDATAAHWRVVQAAKIDAETPALDEVDLIRLTKTDEEAVELRASGTEINLNEHRFAREVTPMDEVKDEARANNPYHQALDTEFYVSIAEIEEEEFIADDGRGKEHLTMTYSDGEPMFFLNGQDIDIPTVMDLVGGTIVDDMREAVRSGNPILWFRNYQSDTDYEVMFEQP